MLNSDYNFLDTEIMEALSTQLDEMSKRGLLFLMVTNRLKGHQSKGENSAPQYGLNFSWCLDCIPLKRNVYLLSYLDYYHSLATSYLKIMSQMSISLCIIKGYVDFPDLVRIYALMFSCELHQILYLGQE